MKFIKFIKNQKEFNKEIVPILDDVSSLISALKSDINILFDLNVDFYNRVRLLQNALIVISSVLVGVIFYLISIS